jgi:hypothetical protein
MSDPSADATPRGSADPAEGPRAPITSELVILSERVAMLEAGLAAQRVLLDRQERWMLEALGAATALLDLEREAG